MAKAKLTYTDVWKARQANYAYHYERRQWARSQDQDTKYLVLVGLMTAQVPLPTLNHFASYDLAYFEGNKETLAEISAQTGVQVTDLCAWYWTEAGWARFLEAFEKLDEPSRLEPIKLPKNLPGVYAQDVRVGS